MNPRRRKAALACFLAACVLGSLAVAAWAAISVLTPAARERPEEAVERKAGMHHDQHHPEGRYYLPSYAKVDKDGTAVLRYSVGSDSDSDSDSSIADFRRTYDITAKPKHTGPSKVTYTDRFGDVRRTFTITYNGSPDTGGYDYARITVRAVPLHTT